MPELEDEKPVTPPAPKVTDAKPARVKAPAATGMTAADVATMFDKLVSTKGDGNPNVMGQKLLTKALRLQADLAAEQARSAKLATDLTAARDAARGAVPEGSVVVPKADADLLEVYRGFGKPEDVGALRDRYKVAQAKAESVDKQRVLMAVAGAYEFKNVELFNQILSEDWAFEKATVKDEKTGRETETYKARFNGPDGKPVETTVPDLIAGAWKAFLPGLRYDPNAPRPTATGLPLGAAPFRSAAAYQGAPDTGQPLQANGQPAPRFKNSPHLVGATGI